MGFSIWVKNSLEYIGMYLYKQVFMKTIATLLLLLFAGESVAMTGNEWLALDSTGNRYLSVTYIQGLSDMQNYIYETDKRIAEKENKVFISNNYICTPSGATYGQSYEVIKKFLTENPEYTNLQMSDLMFLSLGKIWRCKN